MQSPQFSKTKPKIKIKFKITSKFSQPKPIDVIRFWAIFLHENILKVIWIIFEV